MKKNKFKRTLTAVLACMLCFSTFAAIPVYAGDAVTVSDEKLTEIVFGEIFTTADKGTAYTGNLYIESSMGPAYFDGVRRGDWFEFDLNVESAGEYHFCFSFGWMDASGTYRISIDGGETINLKNTVSGKGWRHWVNTTEAKVSLTAGTHTIRVTMGGDGPNIYSLKIAPMNIDLATGAEVGTVTPKESIAMTDGSSPSGARTISDSTAIQFNTTEVFDGMDISSASWNNNLGSLRVSLFKWNTSYNKTLQGEPLATKDYIDPVDNSVLQFRFDEMKAGEYLLYIENITDNPAEEIGTWGNEKARPNIRSYVNGAEGGFCPAVWIQSAEGVEDPFIPVSPIDPDSVILEPSDTDLYPWGDTVEYKMNADAQYGVQFKATSAFKGCEVYIPTVPVEDSTLTLSLYKWTDNYSTTVKASPVATKTLTNVGRSSWARLDGDFPADEYLFSVTDGTEGMSVAMVEQASDKANHYLHTAKAGISLVARTVNDAAVTAPTAPTAQEFISGDSVYWVGTDGLDRVLPTASETGEKREGKYVGIFYHTWHSAFAHSDVVNVTELVTKYPEAILDYNHPAWEGRTNCFWNEPLWGYYNNGIDRWVLRKQAELLADAGVDVVFFDNTNGTMNFIDAILILCEVWAEARADGVKTPQISAMLNMYTYNETAIQIKELYDKIYSKGLYQDLWFYWEGKPLLLGYPEEVKRLENGKEIYDFFSYRPINPSYNENQELIKESDVSDRVTFAPPGGFRRYTLWKWISVYPQEKMYLRGTEDVEEMCVCVAQNWSDKQGLTPMNAGDMVFGRGYTNEFGVNTSDEAVMAGLNIAEQWEYVLEVDPTFVYITGWNEWVAGRYESMWGKPNAIPDNALDGYSRDIEPSTGMLKDHFYNQMVSYIRKFKGMDTQPVSSGAVKVDSAASIDWNTVTPVYRAYEGNTLHRDYNGYQDYHYTNTTGRNDFVESRVTYDAENLYFMVKTAEDITPYTDKAWMRLFIDVVGVEDDKSWETFEYMLNRESPTADKATLERSTGGWNWEKAAEVDYTVSGDTMVVTIPRASLGIGEGDFTVNFKWSDNMQKDGDIMEFYVSGDVAPGERFKYSFTTLGAQAPGIETEPVESDTTATPDMETPTEAPTDPTEPPKKKGCKSSVAVGGLVVVAAMGASALTLRKKKESEV
ncbi:MAG: carbohydrate-binding protein [Clostridia bacterium]|nr:carbohydrate-binding protein [Clostridia bacterium]